MKPRPAGFLWTPSGIRCCLGLSRFDGGLRFWETQRKKRQKPLVGHTDTLDPWKHSELTGSNLNSKGNSEIWTLPCHEFWAGCFHSRPELSNFHINPSSGGLSHGSLGPFAWSSCIASSTFSSPSLWHCSPFRGQALHTQHRSSTSLCAFAQLPTCHTAPSDCLSVAFRATTSQQYIVGKHAYWSIPVSVCACVLESSIGRVPDTIFLHLARLQLRGSLKNRKQSAHLWESMHRAIFTRRRPWLVKIWWSPLCILCVCADFERWPQQRSLRVDPWTHRWVSCQPGSSPITMCWFKISFGPAHSRQTLNEISTKRILSIVCSCQASDQKCYKAGHSPRQHDHTQHHACRSNKQSSEERKRALPLLGLTWD